MRRHTLISRSHRWHHLARALTARQALVLRIGTHQRLAQVLGLPELLAERSFPGAMLPEPAFDTVRQIAPLPVNLAFRPPFEEQVQGENDAPFAPEESQAIPDQPQSSLSPTIDEINQLSSNLDSPSIDVEQASIVTNHCHELDKIEPPHPHSLVRSQDSSITVEKEPAIAASAPALTRGEGAQLQDDIEDHVEAQFEEEKHSSSQVSPPEIVPVRPRRSHVQEQPVAADQLQPVLPPSTKARTNAQKKLSQGSDAPMSETGREQLPPDPLFAPRDTDRSPQAWMARLLHTASASHDVGTVPASESAAARQDGPGARDNGEIASTGPRASTRGQVASAMSFPASSERSRVEQPPSSGVRKLEVGTQQRFFKRARAIREETSAREQPAPLTQLARRFLQPLVGIDPETIPVYRDPTAERLADAFEADALAIGDRVEMAQGQQDETPESLGLLAHEFTHVARRRVPGFIPPIARSKPGQTTAISEEAIAQRVEGRVRRVAQAQVDQTVSNMPEPIVVPSGSPAAVPPSSSASGPQPDHDTWGGLPAPWEPLPDWLVAPHTMTESSGGIDTMAVRPVQASQESSSGESEAGGMFGFSSTLASVQPETSGVQRAGRERGDSADEAQPGEAPSRPQSPAAHAPEPDLDDLARQVYALLKRRLAVEYRREQ